MAKVTVKLFGVLRLETRLQSVEVEAGQIGDIYTAVNEKAKESPDYPGDINFKNTLVYINGNKCHKKKY